MKPIRRVENLVHIFVVVLLVSVAVGRLVAGQSSSSTESLINQAMKFFETGMTAAQKQVQQQDSVSSLVSVQDSSAQKMLRDSIAIATDLINQYRENGLSNMPNLPNLPGLNVLMRLPDKLLRAELSMLQDEIKMAQQMMQNPITATMNAPRDLASMMARMAEQLEQ